MIRLRLSPDGPLLLADGRLALLEEFGLLYANAHDATSTTVYLSYAWQPVPIVEAEDE